MVELYQARSAVLNWYSNCGHLEKSVIKNRLLEVRNDSEEKEPYETIQN